MNCRARERAAFYLRNKKPPSWAVLQIKLVEMRRIELLSEDNTTWISPSAVCVLI